VDCTGVRAGEDEEVVHPQVHPRASQPGLRGACTSLPTLLPSLGEGAPRVPPATGTQGLPGWLRDAVGAPAWGEARAAASLRGPEAREGTGVLCEWPRGCCVSGPGGAV